MIFQKRAITAFFALFIGGATARVLANSLFTSFSQLPTFAQGKTATTNSGTSVALTLNAAPKAANYLYCTIGVGTADAVITAPTGFNTIITPFNAGNTTAASYGRFITANDSTGPYTFSLANGTPTGMAVQCNEYAYVDTVSPFTAISTGTTSVPSGSQTVNVSPVMPTIIGTIPVASYVLSNETSLSKGAGYLDGGIATAKTNGAANPVSVSQYRGQRATSSTSANVTGSASGNLTTTADAATMLVLFTHVNGLPVQPIAYVTPTPVNTPNANVPKNIQLALERQIADGCYHNSHPSCANSSMPKPLAGPTASSAQVQSDINILAKYAHSWEVDLRMNNYAHDAGIKTYQYYDPFVLHNDDRSLNENSFPASIIAKDTSGNKVFMSNYNTPGGSFVGDVQSRGAGSLVEWMNGRVNSNINTQYGVNRISWAREDDAFLRGRARYFNYCSGFFVGSASNSYNCTADHPNNSPTTFSALSYPPENQAEVTGFKYLFANTIRPVVANMMTDPNIASLFDPNLVVAQCENCLVNRDEAQWTRDMDMALTAQTAGKEIQFFNAFAYSQRDLDFIFSCAMLIMQDPKLVSVEPDITGSVRATIMPPSGIPLTPIATIIPTQWIGPDISMSITQSVYPNFQPANALSYDIGVARLKTSTGAYAREAQKCYIKGFPNGPCAIVVNRSTTGTVAHPSLSRTYTHTAVFSGRGIITEFGDNGVLSTSGGQAPSTLPAQSGYVEFP